MILEEAAKLCENTLLPLNQSGDDEGCSLKDGRVILSGLRPDPQRYFDYHHAPSDTFDKINRRELELGAAAMAALIYLMDNHKL